MKSAECKSLENNSLKSFVIALLAIAALGFVGYQTGFLGAVYGVLMPEAFSRFNIVVLSIVLGIAAFFSPCALTIMPAFISHQLAGIQTSKRLYESAKMGLFAAAGIVAVNLVLGAVIGLLGSAAPFAKDPRQDIPLILGVRIAAGLFIAAMGLMLLVGKSFPISFLHGFSHSKQFSKSFFGYGVLYNAAAVGCTGPILLSLMAYALASASLETALLAFSVFSLTMGVLMVGLTLVVGAFKYSLTPLTQATPLVKKTAAIVMIVVGLGIAFLTLEGNKLFVKLFFPYLQ